MACLQLDARALNGLWNSDHWERELSDPDRICIGIAGGADELSALACGWVVLDELQIHGYTIIFPETWQAHDQYGLQEPRHEIQRGKRPTIPS